MFDKLEQMRGGERRGTLPTGRVSAFTGDRPTVSLRGSVFAASAVRFQDEEPQRSQSKATQRPRRKGRSKVSQLRQERDVCSKATITSISERVKHATAICRRRAASEARCLDLTHGLKAVAIQKACVLCGCDLRFFCLVLSPY